LSEPIKLLFDECLGKPLLEDIKQLLSWDEPKPVINHILDYFKSGICDSEWIPQVADGGWIIITSDRGKNSNRNKLPGICLHYKITHILLSVSVLKLKQNQKANAIISVWEDIKKSNEAPKGSRFLLQLTHSRSAKIRQLL
jgi:hypothetical protein